jgi:hypothetical protein
MDNYLEGLERHKRALSSSAIDIPVQSAEYALLGPELEHLAEQSVAGSWKREVIVAALSKFIH